MAPAKDVVVVILLLVSNERFSQARSIFDDIGNQVDQALKKPLPVQSDIKQLVSKAGLVVKKAESVVMDMVKPKSETKSSISPKAIKVASVTSTKQVQSKTTKRVAPAKSVKNEKGTTNTVPTKKSSDKCK